MFVCKTICQGEDGWMKGGCQPGLRNSICSGAKGNSGLCVRVMGSWAGSALTAATQNISICGTACLGLFPFPPPFFHFFPLLPCFPAFPRAWLFCRLAAFTLRDPGTCLQHHVHRVLWDPWDMGMIGCSSGASFHQLSPESWI